MSHWNSFISGPNFLDIFVAFWINSNFERFSFTSFVRCSNFQFEFLNFSIFEFSNAISRGFYNVVPQVDGVLVADMRPHSDQRKELPCDKLSISRTSLDLKPKIYFSIIMSEHSSEQNQPIHRNETHIIREFSCPMLLPDIKGHNLCFRNYFDSLLSALPIMFLDTNM